MYMMIFFFFKQKTAYEIVSRDWSSDVCSSDLISLCARCKVRHIWRVRTKTMFCISLSLLAQDVESSVVRQ